jgi:hypothetical protein
MAAKLQEIFPLAKRNNNKNRRKRSVPRIDYGTPEAVAKRRAIVGVSVKRDSNGQAQIVPNDPSKAESPAGTMLVRGLISVEQYGAVERFAWLYSAMFGNMLPTSEHEAHGTGAPCCGVIPPCKDCSTAKLEAKWRQASAALDRHPRAVRDAVANVAVFKRWPRWLLREIGRNLYPRSSENTERKALETGLNALIAVGCIVIERKVAA